MESVSLGSPQTARTPRHASPGGHVRRLFNIALNLFEQHLREPTPRSTPLHVDIVLTRACNMSCVFCIAAEPVGSSRWMPFELFEQIAEELFPGAHSVAFCSGGEPFLYPRLRDALWVAADHNVRTRVVSNGMRINEEAADWIVADQSLQSLYVSFDGCTPATLERIRKGGRFETVIGNLAELDRRKQTARARYPAVELRYSVMRSNIEELPGIFDVCARMGARGVVVDYLNVANDMDPDESLFRHEPLAREVFARTAGEARRRGMRLSLPALPSEDSPSTRCSYPWRFCMVDTDGAVHFCYKAWTQALGNYTDGFDGIWRGVHYRKLRASCDSPSPYFPYCAHCSAHTGQGVESAHMQQMHADAYVIPGLEHLQSTFEARVGENHAAFAQQRTERRANAQAVQESTDQLARGGAGSGAPNTDAGKPRV